MPSLFFVVPNPQFATLHQLSILDDVSNKSPVPTHFEEVRGSYLVRLVCDVYVPNGHNVRLQSLGHPISVQLSIAEHVLLVHCNPVGFPLSFVIHALSPSMVHLPSLPDAHVTFVPAHCEQSDCPGHCVQSFSGEHGFFMYSTTMTIKPINTSPAKMYPDNIVREICVLAGDLAGDMADDMVDMVCGPSVCEVFIMFGEVFIMFGEVSMFSLNNEFISCDQDHHLFVGDTCTP